MSFSSIIGHDRPIAILKRALAHDALAHAYLFSGDEGIGKRMTAKALAAALNCAAPGADGGCGLCPSCRKIASDSHPDVHLLAPDGDEIKIDQVRELQASLALRAFEGKRKVLIVDHAEAMNEASSNAFLKTLEEPPGESLLVLVTAMPHSLLATIRSRCQEIKFQPLPRAVLAGVLQERAKLAGDDAWFVAALSGGSLGRALAMDPAEERTAREQVRIMLERLPSLRPDELLGLADGVAKDREGFGRLIGLAIEALRDRLVYGSTGEERLLVFAAGQPGPQQEQTMQVLLDLDMFTACRDLLERRVSAQLVAEKLFFYLAGA